MQNPCNRIHNKWVIREDDLTNETPINTCTTGKHSLRMLDNCVMYIYWLISLLFTARNSNLILRMGSFRPRRELVAPWSINLFHFKSSVLPRSSELILPCDDANFKQRKQRMAWLLLTSLDTSAVPSRNLFVLSFRQNITVTRWQLCYVTYFTNHTLENLRLKATKMNSSAIISLLTKSKDNQINFVEHFIISYFHPTFSCQVSHIGPRTLQLKKYSPELIYLLFLPPFKKAKRNRDQIEHYSVYMTSLYLFPRKRELAVWKPFVLR